jgi:RHS repeat-associated protein
MNCLNLNVKIASSKPTLNARAIVALLLFTLLLGFSLPSYAVQDTTNHYQYDAGGNLTQIAGPLDTVANPVKTDMLYDALGQLSVITPPKPNPGATRPNIFLSHDGQGQVTQVEDPRLLTTNYSVDGLGNVTTVTSPDSGIASSTYDEAGNLKTKTDARGKLTTYSYDALNRLARIDYASGIPTIYTYDGGTANTVAANIGKLTAIDDESGQTLLYPEATGRLRLKRQTLANAQTTLAPTQISYWDTPNGKPTGLTYPSGNQVNYSYDANGRIAGVTLNPTNTNGVGTNYAITTPLMTDISYTQTGQFRVGTWGNTAASWNGILHYDDLDGRNWAYYLGNPRQGGNFRFTQFDAAGRITQMSHSGSGTGAFAPTNLDQSFSYDNLGRVTSYTSATGNQSYSYDESGNRTSTGIDNHTIDLNSNRLMNTSGPAPAKTNLYDESGNLKTDGTNTYTYSDRGRLQSAQQGGITTTYTYNGLGQRIMKRRATDAGIVQYVYDEQGHLLGEYDVNGNLIQETVYLGDMPIAVLTQAGINYIFTDHLNTPRVITRASDNQIVWRWDQADPFGVQPPNENPSGLGAFTYNPRFPGQLYDAETGLYYNYHRNYDPKIGSYTQSDPIGLAGGINTYAYVSNNPINLIDPLGLCEEGQAWKSSGQKGGCVPEAEAGYLPGNAAEDFVANCPLPQAKAAAVFGTLGKSIISKVVPKTTLQNPRNLIPTQSKAEMSGSQINRIAKDMKQNGYNGEPVDVSVNPATGRLEIQDGHHRTAAAIKAGVDQIPVRVAE